jgi:SAM-dependent methyltransferase
MSGTSIDRNVSRRFWDAQAQAATDLRSVTLDRTPTFISRLELSLYQGWFEKRFAALGVRSGLIADVGCGNGQWTVLFARLAEKVVAFDFTEGFLADCRRRLEAAGLADKVELVCSDAVHADLPPGTDLVVCGAVTQYLSDDEIAELLPRLRDALAPGGFLYLRTTVAKWRERVTNLSERFQGIYRSMDWYEARFAATGLRVVERARATRYLADELASRWPGIFKLPIRAFFWLLRCLRNTDVTYWFLTR